MTAAVAAAVLVAPQFAQAESVSATLAVSVRVLANARVSVESAPSQVQVTESDVARGYVELPAPVRVRVHTNSQAGYLLTVTRLHDALGTVRFDWDGGSLRLTDGEAWVARPAVPGGDVLSLRGRLELSPATRPGVYPLPVDFTASAL